MAAFQFWLAKPPLLCFHGHMPQAVCSLQLCALPPAKNDSGALDLELYPGFSLPALMRQTWAFEGFLQVRGSMASQPRPATRRPTLGGCCCRIAAAWVPCGLLPGADAIAVHAHAKGSLHCKLMQVGPVQDGDFRWSTGPVYNVQSLRLVAHLFIQENVTEVDREGTIIFDEQPKLETRER